MPYPKTVAFAGIMFMIGASCALAQPKLFTLPRENPWRRVDPAPAQTSAGSAIFRDSARPNEYFVFQLGIIADTETAPLAVEFSDLKSSTGSIPAESIDCLSLGGIGNDGQPFAKEITLAPGEVKVLWCGVMIPENASGTYSGTALLNADGKTIARYQLEISVSGEPVELHGDGTAANLSRLRWLNSTVGSERSVTRPYTPIKTKRRSIAILGRSLELGKNGLPRQIYSRFNDSNTEITKSRKALLADPIEFNVSTAEGAINWKPDFGKLDADEVEARWSAKLSSDKFTAHVSGRLDYSGVGEIRVDLQALADSEVENISLDIPWHVESAQYFMGLNRKGGYRPDQAIEWRWDVAKRQDCFWMGAVNAGMMLRFKDEHFMRPLVNIYYDFQPLVLPESWGNEGRGGISIGSPADGAVPVSAFSGERRMQAGDTLAFIAEIYLTPFHPLDTEQQWELRFVHPNPSKDPKALERTIESMDAEAGPNVLNVHQAHAVAPFINYPYADAYSPQLQKLIEQAHAKESKIKIYYTTRELTQNLPELYALHSLDGEVIYPGPGPQAKTLINKNGPHPWLVENLGDDFIPAWVDRISRPEAEWDLSVITTPDSRWNNFYLEGLQWLSERMNFDGIYVDDTALDGRSMQRARRILDREPGRLIDFHTWNHMNQYAGYANNLTIYMELLPYIDRLWIGEGFSFGNTPDYILVEMSGIPFGLMSEMLDHPNPWRGLLYGETTRLGWSGDPRSLWQFFDEYGIKQTEYIPYFSAALPIDTGREDVKASVFRGDGYSIVVLASWAPGYCSVTPKLDWYALGLDPAKSVFYAPAIRGIQSEAAFASDAPIEIPAGRGWIFVLDETPREIAATANPLDGAVEAFRYNFTPPHFDDSWRTVASPKDATSTACFSSSFIIEGPANRIAGVERDLPAKTVAVQVDLDPGSDVGQTWGIGAALVWPNGKAAKINWRAEDGKWGVFGGDGLRIVSGPSAAELSRTVRITLAGNMLRFEVKGGDSWMLIDMQSRRGLEGDPAKLRLGKLAEDGSWSDYSGAGGKSGRGSLTNLLILSK
jgi:hypothetical protein